MKVAYRKEYSHNLWRDMEYKVFGHAGKICITFPCQDGRFYDFENFGMIHTVADQIEAGRLQVVCADGMDWESLTNDWKSPRARIEQHEAWMRYIIDELAPRVHAENPEVDKMMTAGASLGAYHAANTFFRVPQLFDSVIAMSGLYESDFYFGDYRDDLTYLNSPIHNLPELPEGHPNLELLRKSKMVFCVGQGAWEEELLGSTRRLEGVLRSRKIPAWVDYWGYDVNHDWNWWRIQFPYFMEIILNAK